MNCSCGLARCLGHSASHQMSWVVVVQCRKSILYSRNLLLVPMEHYIVSLSITDGAILIREGTILSMLVYLLHSVQKKQKRSALDWSLLQRNLCLIFFQGIASLRGFTHPMPKLNMLNSIKINLEFFQSCIPVVTLAVRFLLNTLPYFHNLLPIGHSLGLRAISSPRDDYYWNSISPVGGFEVPHIPLFNSYTTLSIHVYVQSESTHQTLFTYRKGNPRLESHSHLLPKS